MPIYAYRCDACGFAQDALQKISDAPLTECPSCHAQALKKQVTAAGFQLKGSGWYATDFRNNKPAPAAAKGDAAAKTEGSASSAPAPAGDSAPSSGDSKSGASESSSASSSGTSSGASCAPGCGCH